MKEGTVDSLRNVLFIPIEERYNPISRSRKRSRKPKVKISLVVCPGISLLNDIFFQVIPSDLSVSIHVLV